MTVHHAPGSMIEGTQALTEKEKQTLRLLLAGHDAKSMARHLGLSVHTVNERLRDARRKLSVSSSKAAARLLRQAEGADPERLGDRELGDAAPAPLDHPSNQPAAAPRPLRRTVWAIGGLAMIAFVAAMLALSAPADGPRTEDQTAPVAESPAARAAADFLALIDAQNWSASYAATGRQFQSVNTMQVWQSVSEKVRAPLGRVVSRKLLSDDMVPAPPNGYRFVRFRTDFEGKPGTIETLSLDREDGAWKVVGITID